MWTYYLFMALMVITLILWAVIALRDDTRESGEQPGPRKDSDAKKSGRTNT